MKQVKLLTADGKYVTTVLIPPFQTIPQTVVWGARFFFPRHEDIKNDDGKSFPDYYEGFAVAAVITAPETEISKTDTKISKSGIKSSDSGIKSPKSGTPAGNDDLHFGLPINLEEAIETFMDYYRRAPDISSIVDQDEDKFSAYAHHGAGQFLRNSFYLWWHEGHTYDSWPKTKPQLVDFFNKLGIYHADDMSSIIITSAWREVHKKDIDLDEQVKHYKDFWKQQGFKDGIFKPGK